MADRNWATDFKTIEHGLIELDGVMCTQGLVGVIDTTNVDINGNPLTDMAGVTFSKTGVGEYTLTLTDPYYKLKSFGFTQGNDGTAIASNIVNVVLKGSNPAPVVPAIAGTGPDTRTLKTVVFNTVDATNLPANPNRPVVIAINLVLKNKTVL